MQAKGAADINPAADPQAPSMVAVRPFLSAARASGKPKAHSICRVKSLNSTAGAVVGVTWAGRTAALRETLGINIRLITRVGRAAAEIRRTRIRSFRPASHC